MKTSRSRRRKQTMHRFVATCSAGLEKPVAGELRTFGAQEIVIHPGAVSWKDRSLESGYRACLWSRFASRILLELASFEAPDTATLYRETDRIDWDSHLEPRATLAVFCTLRNSAIKHSRYGALRVKDAIVDQLRTRRGHRPNIDPAHADIRINLHIDGNRATLSLDLSGDSLHRRGYRRAGGPAPMKETLAAAMVHFSGWSGEEVLLDPLCGSGTLLIEAALMMTDSAPGLQRKRFGFMGWSRHNPKLWKRLVDEAVSRETAAMAQSHPTLYGGDADPGAVVAARKNIREAGLEDLIQIHHLEVADLRPPAAKGMMLTNPPYGERLLDREVIRGLYRGLGSIFRNRFQGWRLAILATRLELAEGALMTIENRKRFYNGPLKCWLLTGTSLGPDKLFIPGKQCRPLQRDHPGRELGDRLKKNLDRLRPWATRERVSCFRLYDADIPVFNLAIDLYEQWVHVQEYAPPNNIPREKSSQRFRLALAVIRECLGVPREKIFIKQRCRQPGRKQYQRQSKSGRLFTVHEDGLTFLVNFTDYLDTGLFLDHRRTRKLLEHYAPAGHFLNLFSYTGTATVYAARGAAASTTSVDSSPTYLARAQANLACNGYGGPRHIFVCQDVLTWLEREKKKRKYDLIFVDPPTFSNNRQQRRHFTVQQDHERLLHLAMGHLTPEGILLFSTNFSKFKMAPGLLHAFQVREITRQTRSPDFQRKSGIHRCWEFRLKHHPKTTT